jgi:cell cycle arrest protein BUB3
MRGKYSHKAAVLDCCFSDVTHAYSGALDGTLKQFDINSQVDSVIGEHEKPIRCVKFNHLNHVVVTGSWDETIKVWDSRAATPLIGTYRQPGRVFTVDMSGHRVVVGTSGRHVYLWDLRRMSEPEQRRESSLKHQTRVIGAYIEGDGFAIGSTEGRVAMEYFDPNPTVQAKKYAFKCHRVKAEDGVEHVYPVNAMAFHPLYGTFATGGGDGIINIWDGKNKKRLSQLRKYPTSIASLSFSADGALLAIAASYVYEQGDALLGQTPEQVFIRRMTDVESKPKART